MGDMLEKVKGLFGISTDDEDDEYEYEGIESEDDVYEKPSVREIPKTIPSHSEFDLGGNKNYDAIPKKINNVVDFQKTTQTTKLILVEPKVYDDVKKICDDLKNKKASIINFENTDKETAQRIIDFMSGATYALSGNVKKVSNSIIVVAPQNVDILGSVKNAMEENEDLAFRIGKWNV